MLDLSSNQLDFIPPEIGCLNLRELGIKDNQHIRVPELVKFHSLSTVVAVRCLTWYAWFHPMQVSEGGTRSLLCYLQTLGEQHRLMNDHMDKLVYSDAAPEKTDAKPDSDDNQTLVRKRIHLVVWHVSFLRLHLFGQEIARLATLNISMLSDIRHVKASDAEKESIREDILKTRERLLNVRTYAFPVSDLHRNF